MTVNTEVKGTLAKLLATENLNVEHRKISTAYFDVEKRVLALPIWKDVTGDVYDLLVGHEVGHALYTPMEDFGTAPKDYVNVLEDARVERKMKVLYPGLRKSFFAGYQELNNQDFFSIRGKDISKYTLLDRINLHFKIGTVNSTAIPFSDDELIWVERVSKTSTFADVVQLAEELYNFLKDKAVDNTPSPAEQPQSNQSTSSDEYDPMSSQEDTTQESTQEGSETTPEMGNQSDDLELAQSNTGGEEHDLETSLTQQSLMQNQESLVDDSAKEWVYLSIPKIDLEKHLISWQVIQKDLRTYFDSAYDRGGTRVEMSYNKYVEYKKSAQKSVNYLVKQFEMKKSADQYARAGIAKTGVLDTNKLHNYKITEDIFKKITVVPDGKNHGLVFQLDWSGSMQNVMLDTLKQLYNLMWFCQKVSIPFEVYAFQSGVSYEYDSEELKELYNNKIYISRDFMLLQLFTSQMNSRQLDDQMKYVWAQVWGMYSTYGHGYCGTYSLGGTPLVEAVIATRQLVDQFLKREKIQKVNVVTLTDGESNPIRYVAPSRHNDNLPTLSYMCHNTHKVHILIDPITRYQRKIAPYPDRTTTEIVSFYREITDYNWIGFRLCSKGEMTSSVNISTNFDTTSYTKAHNSWNKERFVELQNGSGFDVQYLLPNKYIGGGTEDLTVSQKGEVATKSELQRAFKKHMGSKMLNKTLLNKFVEVIA